jgi:uncharacterized protein YggU (UPF0235/DUF167 family)
VKEKTEEGRANRAVVKVLANYFKKVLRKEIKFLR